MDPNFEIAEVRFLRPGAEYQTTDQMRDKYIQSIGK
jgi:hypothetical protein